MLRLLHKDSEATGTGEESTHIGKEEMIELMADDNDDTDEPLDLKEDKKEETEEVEEEDKEKDELDEIEEELEGPDDDKLELATPVRRKEILAAYPDLFKKFPYLEKAYYREQQFTEIVPTIEDAKEAVAKANVLDQFSQDISAGKLERAMLAVKQSGDEAFHHLVDNYMANLAKVDREAHLHVVGNIIKQTVNGMLETARESNNEELQEAAKILTRFVFGRDKVAPPSALSQPKQENTKEAEIQQKEQALLKRQFDDARESLNTRVANVLKGTIEGNIDPRNSMTDYVKRNATRDCQEKLETLLEGDKRLGMVIDKLWEAAFKDGFTKSSLDKIKSAYLTRAKTLLPTVIKQARNEALKGIGKRVATEDDTPKKGPLPAGRTATSHQSSGGKSYREQAKSIPSNVSSRDFLMQD